MDETKQGEEYLRCLLTVPSVPTVCGPEPIDKWVQVQCVLYYNTLMPQSWGLESCRTE